MATKNLLDPDQNELIPKDELRKSDLFPEDDGNANPKGLLDPDENDLIPRDDDPAIGRRPKVRKEAEGLLDILTRAAEGGGHICGRVQVDIGNGLKASSCPSGGLSIFKNGVQVYSVDGLSTEDQRAINEFRERYKQDYGSPSESSLFPRD